MSTSTSRQTLAIYWRHAKRYPTLLIGGLLTIPVTTLVNNFLPGLIAANVMDRLARGDYTEGALLQSFGTPLALFAVCLLIGVGAWRLVDVFMWRLEARVMQDLAHLTFNHLIYLSADFHANNFSGSIVSKNSKFLGAYVRIADTTIYGTFPMLWGIFFTSVILYSRAPVFVYAFNAVVFSYIIAALFVTKPTRQASEVHANKESAQTGALADAVTNILAIKSYSGKQHEKARYKTHTDQTRLALLRLMKKMNVQLTIFSTFTRLIQITALVAGAYSVVVRKADIGTIFLVLSYSSIIADQLFNFSQNAVRNYNRSLGDASGMTKILAEKATVADPSIPEKAASGNGHVVFDQVAFRHQGTKQQLFTDFSLELKPGEKVGLVGHSGSGKTTLTRLLLRFSDVLDGSITIDGQDIRHLTQEDLHERITYVPQEPLLFHRSLSENIAYGKRRATAKEIEHVAKLAHAHEFIKDLPDGYETLVGERGIKLSGGQRQRIAIARAMIKDAPIVLLDEATSALDSESEKLIQDALWKLMEGRTTLVIAHRLSTIQKMDRILVMEDGKIIEQGTHKELLLKKGTYAELWSHQSGGFIED